MTVSAQPPISRSTGNGVTTVFPYTFKIISDGDIEVSVDDVVKTLNVDYTVSGAGLDAGGDITMTTAPAVGTTVVRRRDMAIVRSTDYQDQGTLPAATLDLDIDSTVLMMQQFDERLGRTFSLPASSAADGTMPAPVGGYVLGWDALGKNLTNLPASAGTSLIDLAASSGSSLVGFIQSGTGAVARTVQDKDRERVSVFDFMTAAQIADVQSGALTLNVQAAVNAAFAASKQVYFPSGNYWFGNQSAYAIMIDLSSYGNGISIITDKSVTLTCNTTDNSFPLFFYLKGNGSFSCGDIIFRDLGGDLTITNKGAVGFYLINAAGVSFSDLSFGSIAGYKLTSPMIINTQAVAGSADNSNNRVTGIAIKAIYSILCYYGFNCQNQGDDVVIDLLYTYQNIRSYYVFGVTNHKVNVYANQSYSATTGAVNISRSSPGLPTKAINVRYVARNNIYTTVNHVMIQHVGNGLLGTTTGTIDGITLDLDIEEASATGNYPVKIVTYTGAGGTEYAPATANVVNNVTITGKTFLPGGGSLPACTCTAAYTVPGRMTFQSTDYLTFDQTFGTQFRLNNRAFYNPVWSCNSGGAPVLGSSTLAGVSVVNNGFVTAEFEFNITTGGAYSAGGGVWQFSAQFLATARAFGVIRMLHGGVYHTGICEIAPGTAQITMCTEGAGAFVQAGVPWVWATGDYILGSITFPI